MSALPSGKVLAVSRDTIVEEHPHDPVVRHNHECFDGYTQLKTFMRGKE